MAIAFDDVFDILGKNIYTLEQAQAHQVAMDQLIVTSVVQTYETYALASAVYSHLEENIKKIWDYQKSYESAYVSLGNNITQICKDTIVQVVNEDNPQPDTSFNTAVTEFVRQMTDNNKSVKNNVVSAASVVSGTGTGDLHICVRDKHGLTLENALAEDIVFKCIADSQTGGRTIYNEIFSAAGEYAINPVFNRKYPQGSGCSASLASIDPSASNARGNILTDSDFEVWTNATTLTNWTSAVGTWNREGTTKVGGSYGLKITGNGVVLHSLTQAIPLTRLKPNTVYSLRIYAAHDGTAPAAGTMDIEIVDGSGNVITDDTQTPTVLTLDFTALDGVFTTYMVEFITPNILPASATIRLRCTAALSNGRSIYLDTLSMGEMSQLYPCGVYAAIHSAVGGAWFLGDELVATISNNYAGKFQCWFDKMFGMKSMGLILPSSASPTHADTYITA